MKRFTVLGRLSGRAGSYSKRFRRSRAGNFFYFTFLILGGMFSVLPLVYAVVTSFKPLEELLVFPPRFFVKRPVITNYTALPDLLSDLTIPFSRYVFNSIWVSAATTAIYIIISAMAAFVLAKGKFRGKNAYFWVIQFALMFNATTLGIPCYLVYSKLHMIDTYWMYILPQLATTMGVFLMKQYMEGSIPDALLEAAKIDGAGNWKSFWEIAMPIVKPAWLTLMLFGFRDAWSSAPTTTILTEKLKTLPMITSQIVAGGTARAGNAAAITVIMMIPPILVYLISQSNVVEAMASAGIKE
mgnify:CR=1 FL=1